MSATDISLAGQTPMFFFYLWTLSTLSFCSDSIRVCCTEKAMDLKINRQCIWTILKIWITFLVIIHDQSLSFVIFIDHWIQMFLWWVPIPLKVGIHFYVIPFITRIDWIQYSLNNKTPFSFCYEMTQNTITHQELSMYMHYWFYWPVGRKDFWYNS